MLEYFDAVEERLLMQEYVDVHESWCRMKDPKKNHEEFSPKKYFGSYGRNSDFNWVREVHFIINPNRPTE